ncbi:MAG TPA: hypothetical protein DC047_05265 [Blastocatellia bacterium]|nr:hypothetical protein [Blastocatellia bacterium]
MFSQARCYIQRSHYVLLSGMKSVPPAVAGGFFFLVLIEQTGTHPLPQAVLTSLRKTIVPTSGIPAGGTDLIAQDKSAH